MRFEDIDLELFESWDAYSDCPSNSFYIAVKNTTTKGEVKQVMEIIKMLLAERLITLRGKRNE